MAGVLIMLISEAARRLAIWDKMNELAMKVAEARGLLLGLAYVAERYPDHLGAHRPAMLAKEESLMTAMQDLQAEFDKQGV